jgi:hypothetical protein
MRKLKRITYEQATKLFDTPVYYINAGYFCEYGPCHKCSTDNTDECKGGVFVVDEVKEEE